MTMKEKAVQSIQKEIEKLTASLNRYNGLLEKKIAKCEKLGCNWNKEEFYIKRENGELTQETFNAWFEKSIEEDHVADTEKRLANAIKRFEKANGEWEKEVEQNEAERAFAERANGIELDWLSKKEAAEEEYKKWLEQFKAECLKDGIVIDKASRNYINGETKSGRRFVLDRNKGFTERSFYCYTLTIAGTVYFTSGTFQTCYRYILHS